MFLIITIININNIINVNMINYFDFYQDFIYSIRAIFIYLKNEYSFIESEILITSQKSEYSLTIGEILFIQI